MQFHVKIELLHVCIPYTTVKTKSICFYTFLFTRTIPIAFKSTSIKCSAMPQTIVLHQVSITNTYKYIV